MAITATTIKIPTPIPLNIPSIMEQLENEINTNSINYCYSLHDFIFLYVKTLKFKITVIALKLLHNFYRLLQN
jgi:hypothetical protein